MRFFRFLAAIGACSFVGVAVVGCSDDASLGGNGGGTVTGETGGDSSLGGADGEGGSEDPGGAGSSTGGTAANASGGAPTGGSDGGGAGGSATGGTSTGGSGGAVTGGAGGAAKGGASGSATGGTSTGGEGGAAPGGASTAGASTGGADVTGGEGGTAGAGGSGGGCKDLDTLDACDARADCHAVFYDLATCGCAPSGCCAMFLLCAEGALATCEDTGAPGCAAATLPYCEPPYVVSYGGDCYEGCVREDDCAG